MSKTIQSLNEQREACAKKLNEIFAKCKAENRARNTQESGQYDLLKMEIDSIDDEIAQLEGTERDRRTVDWTSAARHDREEPEEDNAMYVYRSREGAEAARAFTILKRTKPKNTVTDWVGRNYTVGESEKFTPGGLIATYLRGARNESEKRALNEGTSSAGGYTVPVLISAQLIDNVRGKATVFKAGAQTFILNSQQQSIAKITADATAAWVGEGSAITASDPTFGSVAFSAKAIKATIKASIEVLQDSLNIDQAIDQTLTGAFAAELDNAALNGAGSATVPKGILNYASPSIYAMGTNGAALSATAPWDAFCELVYQMNLNNDEYANTLVMPPKVLNTLMKAKDTTNQPLIRPFILDQMKMMDSTKMPINLTKGTSTTVCSAVVAGGFVNLYYGSRLETTIYPATESLAGNAQFSFVAVARGDFQPRREADFGVIKDIL